MKIKTSELIGKPLNWAVAKAIHAPYMDDVSDYSTDWSQGGPLIDAFNMSLTGSSGVKDGKWYTNCVATASRHKTQSGNPESVTAFVLKGEGRLVAVCRAAVKAKLGDTVDIPDELVKEG